MLDGRARVLDSKGEDVTKQFLKGAQEVLRIAMERGAREFIGKSGSPSCGSGRIYDGSFPGRLREGDGVTTALLKRNGIRAIAEETL